MATQWISPTWRMPENSNQSKVDNYSLEFDAASSQYVDLGSTNDLDFQTSEMSISFWINSDTASGLKAILGNTNSSASSYQYLIDIHRTVGKISFLTSGPPTLTSNLTININTWYHVCITKSGTTSNWVYTMYINGSSSDGGTLSTTTNPPANQTTAIGRYGALSGYYFSGSLSNITFYDSVLTAGNITALYNSGTPVNPMALTPLPVAYYPLGGGSTGSAKDQSPNPNTLTVPNDAVPSATVFDFVSADGDRFVIPGGVGAGPVNGINGAMTASIWVNTTAGAVYQRFFNRDRTGGTNRDWFIWKDNFYGGGDRMMFSVFNTSNVALSIRITGSTDPQGDPIIPVNDGKWHHIVGVYDGTETIELYTDGVLQGTNTSAGHGAINTTSRVAIGGYNNGSAIGSGAGDFNGDLSNAQIWNTNLSSAEVVTLYNNGVPLLTGTQPETANLKGWWKMNVDTSNWDGSDWTISNSSANYTNSLQFNGTSSYIDTSSFTTSGDDVTISIWLNAINISASSPSTTGALVYGDANNFIYYNVNEVIYAKINGSTSILVANSGGVPQIFGTGNWHHLAVVKSGSTVTWYVDGSPFSDLGTGGSGGFTMNYIGAAGGSSIYFLDGKLSNVAIFESALDASAITTLYNSGQPETTISSSPLSWWKLDNLTTGIQDSGFASNNGTNNGATISGIAVSSVNGISFGMNTANLVTSDLTRSIPYSSYSMLFDGIDDFISIYDGAAGSGPSSLKFTSTDSFSISCWINMVSSSGQENIISFRGTPLIWLYRSGTTIGFRLRGDSSGTESVITTTTTNGAWHNIVAIRDYNSGSPQLKLYIDNVAVTPVTDSTSGNFDSYDKFSICNDNYSGGRYWFDGNTSNVAIFSSALTEDQILTIYNGSVPNDISNLSPVGWWSLAGDSYYDGTNWICPDLGSGGNNGTSSGMGGTELVGDGPGSTANGVATSMDIPANLKGDAPNSSKNAFSVNMNSADRVTSVPG